MSQATTALEMSRKKYRACSQHSFKTRITRKTISKLKLHNFDLWGG